MFSEFDFSFCEHGLDLLDFVYKIVLSLSGVLYLIRTALLPQRLGFDEALRCAWHPPDSCFGIMSGLAGGRIRKCFLLAVLLGLGKGDGVVCRFCRGPCFYLKFRFTSTVLLWMAHADASTMFFTEESCLPSASSLKLTSEEPVRSVDYPVEEPIAHNFTTKETLSLF